MRSLVRVQYRPPHSVARDTPGPAPARETRPSAESRVGDTGTTAPPASGRRTGPGPPVSAAREHGTAPPARVVKAGGTAGGRTSRPVGTRGSVILRTMSGSDDDG